MKNIALFIALLLASFTTLTAQDVEDPIPASAYNLKGMFNKKATLTAGTIVLLETNEKISSSNMTVGRTVQFKVKTNVMAEEEIVIATGALAIGRIKSVENGTYNTGAEIRIELSYVQAVDGQMVPLNGNEMTVQGEMPNQGSDIAFGSSITSHIMNNINISIK